MALYASKSELPALVQNHLIPSGCYFLFSKAAPQEMLRKAWEQDAKAVNFAKPITSMRNEWLAYIQQV